MSALSLGEFARTAALSTVLATSAQAANASLYEFTLTGTANSFGSFVNNRPATVLPSYFNVGDDVTIRFILDTDRNEDFFPTAPFVGTFSAITSSQIEAGSFTASNNQAQPLNSTVNQSVANNFQAISFESTMDASTHPANLNQLSFQFALIDSNGMQDGQSLFSSPNELIAAQNNFASLGAASSSVLQINLFGRNNEYVDFKNVGYTISQLTPVPEPSAVVLMTTGLLALGAATRRQRKLSEAPAPVAA